jgi:hypothetical protein
MPYPLAHPAAVLPLRRYCPRYLSFPALFIGSLAPDVGYCFGNLHVDRFSHRFFAGAFGFCLPVGVLMLLVFCLARAPLIQILPARYRKVFLPPGKHPVGNPVGIVLSLLIGAWTHILLDSVAHADGWLSQHVPILQSSLGSLGKHRFAVPDLLYAAFTFCGVAWLAHSYLNWLEKIQSPVRPTKRGSKKIDALLLASSVLFFAETGRGGDPLFGAILASIINLLFMIGFVLWTARGTSKQI